jgi:hypothetical protein
MNLCVIEFWLTADRWPLTADRWPLTADRW